MTDNATDPGHTAAIEARLLAYATGIDRRDWASFRTLFTDDAALDYGAIGRWTGAGEITDYMERTHASMGHTMHRLTNLVIEPVVEVDGALRTTSRTYVDALLTGADGTGGSNAAGFQDDEWVNTEHGWQIQKRHFTLVKLTFFENVVLPARG